MMPNFTWKKVTASSKQRSVSVRSMFRLLLRVTLAPFWGNYRVVLVGNYQQHNAIFKWHSSACILYGCKKAIVVVSWNLFATCWGCALLKRIMGYPGLESYVSYQRMRSLPGRKREDAHVCVLPGSGTAVCCVNAYFARTRTHKATRTWYKKATKDQSQSQCLIELSTSAKLPHKNDVQGENFEVVWNNLF